jgi:hypothetical protein
MLLGGEQSNIKQVAVVTRNLKFNRLLNRILANWRFFVVEDLSAAKVIFAERGVKLSEHEAQVVWLTPMPLSEGEFLEIPISLTRLYHLLEAHLFPTPRRHIRVVMEADVDLKIENDWFDGCLVSLSGRGGRITCAHEIPRGKVLDIAFKLAGKVFRTPAEVLYCIPAGDSQKWFKPQIGVLFKFSNEHDLDMLRRFIEKACIESACVTEGIPFNDPCVSWLNVPVDPWDVTDSSQR